MTPKQKTISVQFKTWERLVARGSYGDSMDFIIKSLLDEVEGRPKPAVAVRPADVPPAPDVSFLYEKLVTDTKPVDDVKPVEDTKNDIAIGGTPIEAGVQKAKPGRKPKLFVSDEAKEQFAKYPDMDIWEADKEHPGYQVVMDGDTGKKVIARRVAIPKEEEDD